MFSLARVSVVAILLAATLTPTAAAASDRRCTLPVVGAICAPATVILDGRLLQQNRLGVPTRRPESAYLSDRTFGAGEQSSDRRAVGGDGQGQESRRAATNTLSKPRALLVGNHRADRSEPVGLPVRPERRRTQSARRLDPRSRSTWYRIFRYLPAFAGLVLHRQGRVRTTRGTRPAYLVRRSGDQNEPEHELRQGIPCKVDGRGIGIIEFSYAFTQVLDAMAILDLGAPGWSATDHSGMHGWSTEFLNWLRTNKNGTDERPRPTTTAASTT